MLELIFTRKLRPMIIGSLSGWLIIGRDDRAATGDFIADKFPADHRGDACAP